MSIIIDKTQQLLDEYDLNKRLYESFINEIKHQVNSILQASGITVNAITARLKNRDSLKDKIERKDGKYETIADITDVVGIRIITYFSEDVDKVADIIENEYDIDRENSIDKRESLGEDRFGYCSLHYVVKMSQKRLKLTECANYKNLKCEIQIRSVLQHAWAEIEHDIGYKSAITIPKQMRRNFSRIAGLLEIADKEFNEIRASLLEYEENASRKIDKEEFVDREIDAVILGTMVKQNTDIIRLNEHIAKLFDEKLVEFDNRDAEQTIKELKWFNIITVGQLSKLISNYTDCALKIASEKLKNYERKSDGKAKDLIAFFYLCYAILLNEFLDTEKIEKYLNDLNIGGKKTKKSTADELYQLGLKLNGVKE